MKLSDIINSLATKVGKQNEQSIIDILSRQDIQNISMTDEVANSILNQLITIETAKNNQTVKNHFTALALNPYDTEILNTIDRFELGEEFKAEISANKNSYERYRKMADKLKESFDTLKAAKGNGDDKTIEKYTEKINKLTSEIAQLKEYTVPRTELEKVQEERENSLKDFMIHSKISGLKFANKDIPNDINIDFAKVILQKKLGESKATVIKQGNELKLMSTEDPNLQYLNSQNQPESFEDFMNKTLADSKMLEVSGYQNPNTSPAAGGVTHQFTTPAQGQQPGLAVFQAAAAEAVNNLI